jgi:formate hydrogenlyase subunit 4
MKLLIFFVLLSNMFFPLGMATTVSPASLLLALFAIAAKTVLLAVVVAVIESTNAQLRLFRVPEFLMVAFILSLLALILYFIVGA